MKTAQEIAAIIEAEAKQKNISISKLLAECGLKSAVVDNMKTGSMPSADKIYKIAAYLKVTTDYLLTGVKNLKNQSNLEILKSTEKEIQTERLIRTRIETVIEGLTEFFLTRVEENGNSKYLNYKNGTYNLNTESEYVKKILPYVPKERLEIFINNFVCANVKNSKIEIEKIDDTSFPTEKEFEIMIYVEDLYENEKIKNLKKALRNETEIRNKYGNNITAKDELSATTEKELLKNEQNKKVSKEAVKKII
ncbi:MAG: helix-turn-helix domain-containing protein [Defluviitaleaceae bacterium]|nr:helix-turn-helix domain-containing protein [Defluviitaleaceae bacterium]